MGTRTRRASTDADLAAIAGLMTDAVPDEPVTTEELRWADATYPGGARFIATIDGVDVGAASTGPIYLYEPGFHAFWASVAVVESARCRGVGTALLGSVARHARAAGRTALHVVASERRPEGITFLEHRGFVVRERRRKVRLDITGSDVPSDHPPPGVVLTTLAERPDLIDGVHEVALEGFADIPGDRRRSPGDLAEFRARHVDRSTVPADAFVIAVDAASDTVLGYASIERVTPESTTADHNMVAVARAARGRGIGLAIERGVIAWAVRNGLEHLESDPHDDNAPLNAIYARLGYREVPGLVIMHGLVADILADDA
jgi:GNAT superfamily N-acetyltransferase